MVLKVLVLIIGMLIATVGFIVYTSQLAKRLKNVSLAEYTYIFPDGWLVDTVARGSLFTIIAAIRRMRNSDNTSVKQEGHNFMLVAVTYVAVVFILAASVLIIHTE